MRFVENDNDITDWLFLFVAINISLGKMLLYRPGYSSWNMKIYSRRQLSGQTTGKDLKPIGVIYHLPHQS